MEKQAITPPVNKDAFKKFKFTKPPLAIFVASAQSVGYIAALADKDPVYREILPVAVYEEKLYSHVA